MSNRQSAELDRIRTLITTAVVAEAATDDNWSALFAIPAEDWNTLCALDPIAAALVRYGARAALRAYRATSAAQREVTQQHAD